VAIVVALGLAAGLATGAWSAAAGAPASDAAGGQPEAAAPETPASAAPEKPDETPKPKAATAAARLEKQVTDLEQKLTSLGVEEMDVALKTQGAMMKANEFLQDPKKAPEDIAKGRMTPELREYQKIMRACAHQWQVFDVKYTPVMGSIRALQRDKATAEFRPRLAALDERAQAKHRANLQRMAEYLERAGDTKIAIEIYGGLLQGLPEGQRAERRSLKEKIAGAYEQAGDFKRSLAAYKEVYEMAPKDGSPAHLNLMLKLAYIYDCNDDPKGALEMYREVKKNLRPGMVINGLDQAIARCEARAGSTGPGSKK
jgi:tetratricopeptide (TPR) repeat protein